MGDFCEVVGLTVQLEEATEELIKWTVHSDGLPYRMAHNTVSDVYTNLETGKSATRVSADNEKVLSVTDNGDGTLTFIQFVVFNGEIYDEDGNLIGQHDGHFMVTRMQNHQGTLSNPNDDTVVRIDLSEVVENGEAVDDIGPTAAGGYFCTVMVEEIG